MPIPKPPQNGSIDINYTKFRLKNGIKCVLYPRSEIHSVSLRFEVTAGSLDETAKTNGLAHFLEHVVHDATEKLPSWDAIDNFTNEYSGSTNAYTTGYLTEYYGTFPFQYLEQAIFYFSQLIFHPLLKEKDLNKERNIILDEIRRGDDDVDRLIFQQVKNIRFKNNQTPFSFDVIGKPEKIEKYTIKELRDFYKKYYVPGNIEVYIVGNIDEEKAKKLLEKYFYDEVKDREFPKTPDRKFKKTYPDYSGFTINARQKLDLNQYYLTVTFPGLEFMNTSLEERSKLRFLKGITASSSYFQSILWKRLREELQIVYGVSTWSYDMHSRGILAVETSFEKKYLETVLKEVWEGLNKIKSKKIDDSVFEAMKKRTIDTQLMQLDKPENILNWIASYEEEIEEHGKGMLLKEYLEFINSLKFEEVIDLAANLYDWSRVNISIISKDKPEEVEENLTKIWNNIQQLKLI